MLTSIDLVANRASDVDYGAIPRAETRDLTRVPSRVGVESYPIEVDAGR